MAKAGARSLFAAMILLAWVRKPQFSWRPTQWGAALAYTFTVCSFIIATDRTTAANAIFLQYTAPIYVAVLGHHVLGERTRRRVEIACLTIGAVAVGYLAFWANRFTYDSWAFGEVAQGLLPLPIWIPQASFALGSILLWIAVLDELVIVLRGAKPSYVAAVEERHARGDFSSDV